jgi:hypothetical protein
LATAVLYTLMETEFQNCLVRGTSVQEEGLRVSIKRLKDETIQFYRTDCDIARNKLCMRKDEQRSCDYVVLYGKSMQENKKEVICFLELKGRDFDHAVAQVCNTYKHLTTLWKDQIERSHHQYVVPCTSICMHGRAPSLKKEKRGRELLLQHFKTTDYIRVKHGTSDDKELGHFLRKLHVR